jgi:7,8-dihydroneopterin aldolase/epimerase/oxygenase
MIGTVGLKDLRIDCVIGIYPHERAATQPLFVDVEVEYDFAPAASSEGIEDALNYDELARELTRLAVEQQYELLETFVEEAASHCLQHFSTINLIRLTARKPQAVEKAAAAFAKIERIRA